MLRVAILESEEMVKNILFILGDILKDEDCLLYTSRCV